MRYENNPLHLFHQSKRPFKKGQKRNKKVMENYLQVGQLRQKLSYKSREAMAANWQKVFNGAILPEDHHEISIDELFSFLESTAKPVRGRSGMITAAAKSMLSEFDAYLEQKRNLEKMDVSFFEPEKIEQPIIMPENESPESSPKAENLAEKLFRKLNEKGFGFEVAYYFTVVATCYGVTTTLRVMGVILAILYVSVSIEVMKMAKDRKSRETARNGIIAVWVFAFFGFWVHLTMFNTSLWLISSDLPFRVESEENRIFIIAAVIAAIVSGIEIYSVSARLSLTTEAVEAENFEAKYNEKY